MELGGLQRLICFKYYNIPQWESILLGSMLPKIPIISKSDSNKSCWELLHFLQKTQWTHISISPRSRDRRLQCLPCLKHYYVLKRESRLTLELIAIFGVPLLHSWKRWTYAPTEFFVKNLILNNFLKLFFYIICIFGSVEP